MNKADLVEKIAGETGLSKRASEDALDAMIGAITKALAKGQAVTLIGFGTFSVKKRKARIGINPQTKAKIKIPAKKVPAFKAGAALKAKVK